MRLSTKVMHAAALILAIGAARAQDVTLRVLLPYEGAVIPAARPALRQGIFSGYGVSRASFASGIYMGLLGDTPPPGGVPVTFIAANGDVVPNNPTRTFVRYGQPSVWNGTAYFSGGGSTNVNDGTYAGRLDGSPLAVAADRLAGEPWMVDPVAGESGLAYIHAGVYVGTGAGMSLFTYDHQNVPFLSYNQAMPGGGSMQSTSVSAGDGWISQGGRTIAFAVRCNAPIGSASGVYAWDVETGVMSLVANWTTPIPGDGRLMLYSVGVDTDGARVSFVAGNGNPTFGGVQAVCVADRLGGGLATIARTGQPVVGVSGSVWRQFLLTAIDGSLVYFQAAYAVGSSERFGMFAHDTATGETFAVMVPGQVIGGHAILAAWFVPGGIEGADAVAECEYVTADAPSVAKYMLVHARIARPCDGDVNCDFALDGFDVEVQELAVGGTMTDYCAADPDFNGDFALDGFDVEAVEVVVGGGPCP